MNNELEDIRVSVQDQENNLRELLLIHFKSMEELPIKGGWGYTVETAIIIDKKDPTVVNPKFFNGVGIEYKIVEKRIYEELIILRPAGDRYCGIEWKLEKQNTFSANGRQFDHLLFNVSCFRENDWEMLKAEFENPVTGFDFKSHFEKKESFKCHYKTEYFFDITSFF